MPPLPAHNRKSISQAGPKGNDFFAATRPVRRRAVTGHDRGPDSSVPGGNARRSATAPGHGTAAVPTAGTQARRSTPLPPDRRTGTPRTGTTPLPAGKPRAASHASALRAERAPSPQGGEQRRKTCRSPGRPASTALRSPAGGPEHQPPHRDGRHRPAPS